MAKFFNERGYPNRTTSNALEHCRNISREESLEVQNGVRSTRPVMVLTYHPRTTAVSNIIHRNWRIINDHRSTADVFTEPPLIAHRRDKNVKDLLVRSTLPNTGASEPVGTVPCRRNRCNTCRHVEETDSVTGPSGSFNILSQFTCTSTHIIYAIGCHRHHGVLYIGETERRLADRFREHRRDIVIRDLSKPVPQHFIGSDHTMDDVFVTGLVHVHNQRERRTLEERTIFRLGTLQPHGMNIKFQSFNLPHQ